MAEQDNNQSSSNESTFIESVTNQVSTWFPTYISTNETQAESAVRPTGSTNASASQNDTSSQQSGSTNDQSGTAGDGSNWEQDSKNQSSVIPIYSVILHETLRENHFNISDSSGSQLFGSSSRSNSPQCPIVVSNDTDTATIACTHPSAHPSKTYIFTVTMSPRSDKIGIHLKVRGDSTVTTSWIDIPSEILTHNAPQSLLRDHHSHINNVRIKARDELLSNILTNDSSHREPHVPQDDDVHTQHRDYSDNVPDSEDLYPPSGYPTPGYLEGGGLEVGPSHPIFSARVQRPSGETQPHIPPGARYDPIGPVTGYMPGRGAQSRFGEPQPDHMRPPQF